MTKKLTYKYVKNYIQTQGYILLSEEYIHSNIKLEVQCSQGHKYEVLFHNFKKGQRCPFCRDYGASRRLTYEYIKKKIESNHGYILLSKSYKDAHTKLEIQCPKGHKYKVSWDCFQQGRRCPLCNKNKGKLTYEFVKSYIESFKYKLISKEYHGSSDYLIIKCPDNHKYKVKWNSFHNGNRCPFCANEKRRNILKLNYDYIKNYIESFGYILLSKEYINGRKKIKIQCPEGHIYMVQWNSFQQGRRCSICMRKNSGGRLTYKFVKEYIESFGYKLLSKTYTHSLDKLKVRCLQNHEYMVSFQQFCHSKTRCPTCQIINSAKNQRLSYEYVKNVIEQEDGYKLLSNEYIDSTTKLQIQCPKKHKFEMGYSSFRRGYRCPLCIKKTHSKISQELFWLIYKEINHLFKGIYFAEYNKEYRIITKKSHRKLDFYIKDINKCIEFDGDYWHQDKEKDLKREKQILSVNPSLQILHIKESDYRNSNNIIVQKCIDFCNEKLKNDTK